MFHKKLTFLISSKLIHSLGKATIATISATTEVVVLWWLIRVLTLRLSLVRLSIVERLWERCLPIWLLGLLGRHWTHRWHHTTRWRHLLLRLALFGSLVSLHIAAHPEITDLLLQLNQLVIQLGVELVCLSKHIAHLVLSDNCVVQLVEESGFCRVKWRLANNTVQGLSVLCDNLRNVLSLLL